MTEAAPRPPAASDPTLVAAPAPAIAAPSLAIAAAMGGDGLLYAVLPLYAEAFGVSLLMVGVLLSVNRWVRLAANSAVARWAERLDLAQLMRLAAVGAVLSTAAYALAPSTAALLAARVLWGICYAVLNLGSLAYAMADAPHAGRRVGVVRATIGGFQAASLIGGSVLVVGVGAREAFGVLAITSLIAVIAAWRLPAMRVAPVARTAERWNLAVPNRIEAWTFGAAIVFDGLFVFTLSLRLAEVAMPVAPVIAAASLIAARRGLETLTSPMIGRLCDRLGPRPVVLSVGVGLCVGLALIAADIVLIGAALIVALKGMLDTSLPALVAATGGRRGLHDQARLATWRDFGAAVGPLVAGAIAGKAVLGTTYGIAALATGVLLVVCLQPWRRATSGAN